MDFSRAFIEAADQLRASGTANYTSLLEGEIRGRRVANVPSDIDRKRVRFAVGDACNLSQDLKQFDVVLAANLLCRLPSPVAFLDRCKSLIVPGGCLVLVSPYSWLTEYTDKASWLGGTLDGLDGQGNPRRSREVVAEVMKNNGFVMESEQDIPFLIREHARKFQWGCSHATVWRKRK